MGVLGKSMKASIETIDGITGSNSIEDVEKAQLDVLKDLLKTAKETSFGKYYGFNHILDSDDLYETYRKNVPIFDYYEIDKSWWKQQQKFPDITWPGKPSYFALTSGTTGNKSKRIPITDEYISSTRSVAIEMIRNLANFDLPETFFEKEILMLSSSSDLKSNKNNFKEGEISGINVHNFPEWYDFFYRPGKEISAIENWDERIQRIVKEAPSWDIGSIAGIPAWVLTMLQSIVEHHNLETIHDIWPNFKVYSSGGVAFETYRESFEKICGKEIHVLDTYLASEGFFAYTARPNTMAMKLAIDNGFFYEFIPFDSDGFDEQGNLLEEPRVLSLKEIEEGKEYALLVSSCSGLWRYFIGDTIRLESKEKCEILITGRTKFFLNVTGAQLSEEKMDEAILKVSEQHNVEINEYAVAAIKSGKDYFHQWVLISENKFNENDFISDLDNMFEKKNKNYRVAREKTLKAPKAERASKAIYHDYLESSKQKGGQVKTPKVMSEEKMKAFLDFIHDKQS